MSWDDTKTDSVDKVFAADWNAMTADQKARAGTSSSTFQIDDDDTGPKLKNVAGELQARTQQTVLTQTSEHSHCMETAVT